MKLYDWCTDCVAPPEPVKALIGDAKEEATLYLSKDSLLWKTNAMGGISLSAIKMVEAEDENTLSIGYSSGTRVESLRIKLLDSEQFEWNKPLLKWYLHLVQGDVLTTSAMKVFQQYYLAFRREFERWFDVVYHENRFAKCNIDGDHWQKVSHPLTQLLEKEYPILLKYHPKDPVFSQSPHRIHLVDFPKFSYETQLNCAKLYYLVFMGRMASAKCSLIQGQEITLYSDSEDMSPDDYEKLFMHYGLVEKPFLSEEFKTMLMKDSNAYYVEEANGPRPKDYKQWFLKPVAPTVSK